MPEPVSTINQMLLPQEPNNSGASSVQPQRPDYCQLPQSHEERLEWVKKSCERFFEKVRELETVLGLPELN